MKYLIFSFVLGLVFSLPLKAAVDPEIQWKVLRSTHFDLVYDAQQQDLATIYLDRLEKARKKLAPLWAYIPERLTIVINDRTDLTNGYATALPYAHVVIFPVLPGPLESIGEYGDWTEEILIHELTHILSFEQRRGGAKFLSHIFGRIITPNMLLPRWFLEGVAVDAETRLSDHGRLRSTYQDATLRALASTSKFQELRLAEINESSIPTWPYGARPYLFGSLLWSEMIALKGEKMISELHEAYGGRVPYLLSHPVEERFDGENLSDLFARMKKSVSTRVSEQQKVLSAKPFSSQTKYTDKNFLEMLSPRISPDGLKLAVLAKDDTLKRSIQVMVRPDLKTAFHPDQRVKTFGQKDQIGVEGTPDLKLPRNNDAPPGGAINRISWAPDSKSFAFDLIEDENKFRDISDLWVFSLETGKAKALSKSLRAREPDVSPGGDQIAFVKVEAGRTSLGIFNIKSEESKILYQPQLFSRVAWPVWLDSERILISVRIKGSEYFEIVNLNGEHRRVSLPMKEVTLPFKRGSKIFFVSSESGVRNLYQTDLDFKNVQPATHLWTGAYAADFDENLNELWVTQIGETGFEIGKISTQSPPKDLPRIQPLMSDRYPARSTPTENIAQTETANPENENYSALPYLWPRYWLPFVYWDDKGTQVSASTGGFDPLQKHSYSLYGSYDSATKRSSYVVSYANQSFTPTLVFQSYDLSSYLANPDQKTRTQSTSVKSRWQLTSLSKDLFFDFGGTYLAREQSNVSSKQMGPTAGLSYMSLSQSGEQISPEAGGSAALTTTQFLEGEDREHYNLTSLALTKYGKIPLAKHHAYMARVLGQYIDRNVKSSNLDSTASTVSAAMPVTQTYLMRGYVTGAFLGKSIANANLEYRFPVARMDAGSDNFALFWKRVSGAIVADGIWLEGYTYDDREKDAEMYRRVTSWKGFGSAGAEGKFDITLGYHIEMQLVLGVYMPLTTEYTRSEPRLGLGLAL